MIRAIRHHALSPSAGYQAPPFHRPWAAIVLLALTQGWPPRADAAPPAGNRPAPVDARHMPDRLHTFVFRNWQTAELKQMARVLGTTPENVRALGESMGLPPHRPISPLQQERGYISVIRRNWHLLNDDQLLALLGWDAERLAYTLKEDDFLWVKLGRLRPDCPPLHYEPPGDAARRRCAEIRTVLQEEFGDALAAEMEPRFGFVKELSTPLPGSQAPPAPPADDTIRFLYSYFAVYGDPLLNPELDPYPDGLLQRLAFRGVNGVWLHTVLRQLAPCDDFPEFGQDHQTRLENLRRLVSRAATYGIKVYLYMNEPRSMPADFFDDHPDIAGAREDGNIAMCTSVEKVRRFVRDSLAYVFREVPGLGGIFTITYSENLTNCYSRGGGARCPRCAQRSPAEVVAEINRTMAEGVWQGNPEAAVIVWDWGWADAWAEEAISGLPDGVRLMSVSEWSKPISRGGVPSEVGEYSISGVGPGPRAERHWSLARQRGLKVMAKVQVNCTWELSAVPWLPVLDLVARHMDNLRKLEMDGCMLSWTLGGYPSPNLELVQQFQTSPEVTMEQALRDVATRRYGAAAANQIVRAWIAFSRAFMEYPFHVGYVYAGPSQVGPANLLYPEPTGYHATMVGFPYDDVNGWRAVYPADILEAQFTRMAEEWDLGIRMLRGAMQMTEGGSRATLEADLGLAEAAGLHFRSVANQIRFTRMRDAARAENAPADKIIARLDVARRAAEDEIEVAKAFYPLTLKDARIGYEASNHYYYYPLDLAEKVINCRYILDTWLPAHLPEEEGGPQIP
jgi:hypothetical protein